MIEQKLRDANERLKKASIQIAIEKSGVKLRLRGTFPNKVGGGQSRQRIILDYSATEEGIRLAELEAYTVRRNLDKGLFTWDKYLKSERVIATCEEWACKFEEDYFNKHKKTEKSLTTWRTDYLQVFKKLPKDNLLTTEILKQAVLKTTPDSRTRKRYVIVLNSLALFAGLEADFNSLSGTYSCKTVNPRNLPEDETIVKAFNQIANSSWRWVFGILATYGLRNHEVFKIDFEALKNKNPVIWVVDGKTGSRKVWPFYPEWFKAFELEKINLPEINMSRSNASLGNAVSHYFGRKIPSIRPYDLRHAWAVRSLEFGLDITLSAQQMGHSVRVHSDLYHHWISEKSHQQAYELIMRKADRPQPPK